MTASPVHAAYKNTMYHLNNNGQVDIEVRKDKIIPFDTLIKNNMTVFEQALFTGVSGTAAGLKAMPNVPQW
jgi:hypothetical protein